MFVLVPQPVNRGLQTTSRDAGSWKLQAHIHRCNIGAIDVPVVGDSGDHDRPA